MKPMILYPQILSKLKHISSFPYCTLVLHLFSPSRKSCPDNKEILKWARNFNNDKKKLEQQFMAIMGKLSEEDILVTFIYEKLRSGDITQGLPKVEQVLEVRSSDSKMKERGNMFSY